MEGQSRLYPRLASAFIRGRPQPAALVASRDPEIDAGHLAGLIDAEHAERGWADVAEGATRAERAVAVGVDDHEWDGIRGVRGVRAARFGIDHQLAVAVIGGHEEAGAGLLRRGDHARQTAVYRLRGLD